MRPGADQNHDQARSRNSESKGLDAISRLDTSVSVELGYCSCICRLSRDSSHGIVNQITSSMVSLFVFLWSHLSFGPALSAPKISPSSMIKQR